MKFLFTAVWMLGIQVLVAKSQRVAEQLRNDLFSSYDPISRPVANSTTVTNVCVGLYVLQIVDLSEKSQVTIKMLINTDLWEDYSNFLFEILWITEFLLIKK